MPRMSLETVTAFLAQVPDIVQAPSSDQVWMLHAGLADAPNVIKLHEEAKRLRVLDTIDGIRPDMGVTTPTPLPNAPQTEIQGPQQNLSSHTIDSLAAPEIHRTKEKHEVRVSHKAFARLFSSESSTSAPQARPKWWSTPIVTPNVVRPTQHRAASAPPQRRSCCNCNSRVHDIVHQVDVVPSQVDVIPSEPSAAARSPIPCRDVGRVASQWQTRRAAKLRRKAPSSTGSPMTDAAAAFNAHVSVDSAWVRTIGSPTPPRLRRHAN